MNPESFLREASKLIAERGKDYGGIQNNFENIAKIASVVLRANLTAYDIAVILACVKIARMRNSPDKADNYLDAVNYWAFAHELRPQQEGPKEHVEVDVPVLRRCL